MHIYKPSTLFTHSVQISVTVVLHNLFHHRKCIRTLDFNSACYIIYMIVLIRSSSITLNYQSQSTDISTVSIQSR